MAPTLILFFPKTPIHKPQSSIFITIYKMILALSTFGILTIISMSYLHNALAEKLKKSDNLIGN